MKIVESIPQAVIIAGKISIEEVVKLKEDLKGRAPGQIISVPSEYNPVLADVQRERKRQDEKWGVRDQPSFYEQTDLTTGIPLGPIPLPARFTYYGIPTEEDAKKDCENTMRRGKANWGHILVEEVSEAFGTTDEIALEKELIQVAAVATAWIENIRRRRATNAE